MGGSGYIKTFEYTLRVEKTVFEFSVGSGGCNRDNDWNSWDEDGRSSSVYIDYSGDYARGGAGYGLGYRYDGGGGGGVLVNGKGPQIRKDRFNHESGQGYGAGGSYGYDGGYQECGTDGLIIVEIKKC